MNIYPDVVTRITADYLERVKAQLRLVPVREQDEFLREIQSHLYEAYQETPGEDEVARILAVLRKMGEPAEVVSDRLPGAMMRAGTKGNLPLYIVGGIVIALFGIPLGFGGVGVLIGLLGAVVGLVAGYYATAGGILLVGAAFALSGLARIYQPELWDRLVMLGFIQMDMGGRMGEFFDALTPSGQGFVMIVFGAVFLACGLGMLWLGRYLLRGLRFLFGLVFDWTRRIGRTVQRNLRLQKRHGPSVKSEARLDFEAGSR